MRKRVRCDCILFKTQYDVLDSKSRTNDILRRGKYTTFSPREITSGS